MSSDILHEDEIILGEQWVIDGWNLAGLSHCNGENVVSHPIALALTFNSSTKVTAPLDSTSYELCSRIFNPMLLLKLRGAFWSACLGTRSKSTAWWDTGCYTGCAAASNCSCCCNAAKSCWLIIACDMSWTCWVWALPWKAPVIALTRHWNRCCINSWPSPAATCWRLP